MSELFDMSDIEKFLEEALSKKTSVVFSAAEISSLETLASGINLPNDFLKMLMLNAAESFVKTATEFYVKQRENGATDEQAWFATLAFLSFSDINLSLPPEHKINSIIAKYSEIEKFFNEKGALSFRPSLEKSQHELFNSFKEEGMPLNEVPEMIDWLFDNNKSKDDIMTLIEYLSMLGIGLGHNQIVYELAKSILERIK